MLSTPPAFVLSQDQTLQNRIILKNLLALENTSFCFFTSFSRSDSVASPKWLDPHICQSIFSSQGSFLAVVLIGDSLYILPQEEVLVNNFFWISFWKFFEALACSPVSCVIVGRLPHRWQIDTIQDFPINCKPFFSFFVIFFTDTIYWFFPFPIPHILRLHRC